MCKTVSTSHRRMPDRTQSVNSSRISAQLTAKDHFSLVGRTLAEENLHGFSFKKKRATNESSLNPYCPQRIELPLYFNTPRRKDDLINSTKYRTNCRTAVGRPRDTSFINHSSALNMSCVDSADRIISKKRLRDYALLAFACKRANKLRVGQGHN